MFNRNEEGKLVFQNLDFEIMIADMLENTHPSKRQYLDWMVKQMVDSIQLVAWEYWKDEFPDEDEWEDLYYLA
jgi:hypothetical protein